MASPLDRGPVEFTEFHLFCGIGGGALGAASARATWLGCRGSIRTLGGIDFDPAACADFERFTGIPATCLDLFDREQYVAFHGKQPPREWREATPADVRRAASGIAPDIVFSSPPCKGFSGLLPSASAGSEKYQALNRLTTRAVRLTLEAFKDDPPAVFLIENVPRIRTRGAELLDEIKALLRAHGYRVTDSDHDCGEIGGLGQRRKRYLMIARNPKKLAPFIYQPPKRALKTIGDVIGPLALPDDPSLGPMHRLPRLKWLTWLRLALIPAGGDWRDLQKIQPEEYRIAHVPRGGGPWGVQDWNEPGATVTGSSSVKGSNAVAVADPRIDSGNSYFPRAYQVDSMAAPARTVTGGQTPSAGGISIADPRIKEKGTNYNGAPGLYGVNGWNDPAKAVTGGMRVPCSNTPAAVADPRLPNSKGVYPNRFKVGRFDEPAACITGDTDVQCGAQSIADPRLKENENRHFNIFRVQPMDEPLTTVTGTRFGSGSQAIADVRLGHDPRPGVYRILRMDETAPTVVGAASVGTSNGPQAVADHRLGCKPRGNTKGPLGVQEWEKPGSTVFGSLDVHAGPAALADPRIPGNDERPDPPPVIVALDGTWHRPLTTLELLALQSFPVRFANGSPVVLSGKSDSKWRERVGNAVPPDASRGIHEQILLALVQHHVGETYTLGTTPVWVRRSEKEREVRA